MASVSVGSVSVDVVPSVSGFARRMRQAMLPDAVKVGDEIGRTMADRINRQVSRVEIKVDAGNAVRQVVVLDRALQRLDGRSVQVTVDVEVLGAMAELAALNQLLGRVENTAHETARAVSSVGSAGRGLGGVSAGLKGLRSGAAAGTAGVAGLGTVASGVFAGMGTGIAGIAAGVAGLGVALALSNDQIKQTFSDTFTGIKEQAAQMATPFIGPLNQVAGIIKSTFASIAPALSGAFKTLAPALVPLAQGIGAMFKNLSTILQPLADVGAKLLASLGGGLAMLGKSLAGFLQPVLAALNKVAGSFFQTLLGGIGQLLVTLGPLIATLIEVGATLIGPLLGAVNTVLGALVSALVPLLRTMAPIFAQLVGAIAPLVAQLVAGLAPILLALAPILSNIFTILQPVISTLISALQPVIASLVPVIGLLVGALGKIIGAIVPLLVPIGQLIASLVNGLMPVLTPIINLIAQTAATIIGALVQAITACLPALQQIVLAVASLLPALLPIVPLFSQLALAIIPILPPIVNLVAVLVTALVPVLRLVINVIVRIQSTILGLLIPVVRLLASAITWLAEILVPVINGIVVAVRWLGQAATWLWKAAIQPAFAAIAQYGKWLYNIFAVVVLGPLILQFKNAGNIIRAVWQTIIRPALNAFIGFLRNQVAPAIRWWHDNVIRPVFNKVAGVIRTVWQSHVRPVFNNLKDGVGALGGAFSRGVSAIGKAWDKLRDAARKPVAFVVNTVFNRGIVRIWNAVAKLVPGVGQLGEIKGFKTGGIYPGYTPGRDVGYIGVSGGEAIMRPEWTRAVGSGFVHAANAAARNGGVSGVRDFMGGFGGNFALGGIVGGFLKAAKNLFTGGLVKTATAAFNPLLGMAQRTVGGTPFGDLAVSVGRGLVAKILAFFKPLESKIGGDGRKVVSVAEKYVGLSGNPNKFTQRMGINGLPWCGAFVDGVFAEAQASKALKAVSWTPLVSSYRSLPQVPRGSARPGDLGLYRSDAGHINIFTGKGAVTIGGNESNSVRRQSGYINSASSIRRPAFASGGIVDFSGFLAQDLKDNRSASTPPATSLLRSLAGLQVYDSGGWLPTGPSLVYNGTGSPEAVLTGHQLEGLANARTQQRTGPLMHVENQYVNDAVDVDQMAQRLEFATRSGSFG